MNEEQRGRGSKRCGFVLACVMAVGAAFGVAACGGGDASVDGAGPTDDGGAAGDAMAEDAGPTIDVPRVTVGGDGVVDLGAMSDVPDLVETVHIAVPYAISKYPITVSEYRACVEAGACKVPDLTPQTSFACSPVYDSNASLRFWDVPWAYTYELKDWESLREAPVTCMSPDLAREFCAWTGGALSTVGEWMYAARGPRVQEYPWGTKPPTCAENPSVDVCPPGGPKAETPQDYWVGRHPKSASWVGMEDVLLITHELMGREPLAKNGHWGSLSLLGIEVQSAVDKQSGLEYGSIHYAFGMSTEDAWNKYGNRDLAWSFRCTWRLP